jgi:hypothetical protein
MNMKELLAILFITASVSSEAQSTYLLPGMKDEWLLNRMEIKFNTPNLKFSPIKPFDRKNTVYDILIIDSGKTEVVSVRNDIKGKPRVNLSNIDHWNIQSFLMSNSEWSTPKPGFQSKKPTLKHFYKNKANAFEIKNDGFHLIFNPIIQYQQYKEQGNDENVFLNSRGLYARGLIENRIGFSFYFTENQERPPAYVNEFVEKYQAVPGIGFFKGFKNNTGYDYFDTRASVSWKVAKFMDMQLAYDKNFIGNGYRSLFLSDFSNSYTFLKINTHFKRFRYQNIFAELLPYHTLAGNRIYPRKYFRANYLNFSATNWLNLGLFEGTMMGKNKFNVALFNPVMYLHFPNDKNAINDRSYAGFDIKANFLRRFQLYGQLMIDKLKTGGLADKTWDNRFGYQAGLKYIDAFGVRNLDLQFESNRVRPYTYAANDSMTNYTHYNQPLAHPLGANFQEFIFIIKAQPITPLYLQAKAIGYYQGLDLATYNLGSNLFGGFDDRLSDTRVKVGDGDRATGVILSFLASYELRENLSIDAAYTRRNYETLIYKPTNTSFFSVGVRLNMARREFDF